MRILDHSLVFAFLFIFLIFSSCVGKGNDQSQSFGSGLEGEGDIALVDKTNLDELGDPSGMQGVLKENEKVTGDEDTKDSETYIKIHKGTPTIGGKFCPNDSELVEGSNNTAGSGSVSSSDKDFTCKINFSTPFAKVPTCVLTSLGWATPPDTTFKIETASVNHIEITGISQTEGLGYFGFNYICIENL